MAYRRTFRRVAGRRPRRKIVFAREGHTGLLAAAGAATTFAPLANFETTYGAQLLGATIMRIRGHICYSPDEPGLDQSDYMNYGFIVMPSDPLANSPSPNVVSTNDDRMASWMWWDTLMRAGNQVLAGTTGSVTERNLHRSFDVRARRVLRQMDDRLIFSVAEGATAAQGRFICVYSVAIALP